MSFPRYPKYKASGVEWLGDVPEHWVVKPIRLAAKLESGHTPSRSHPEYWEECTVPWISLSDVWQIREGNTKYIYETKEKVSELGLANSSARLLPKNTVVLSRTASVGFSAIMGVDMATTQDFANWICGPLLLPEFLLNVFRSMHGEFRRLMMGSTHNTIYMPDIQSLRFTQPPLDEQSTIASFLDRETSKIDGLVAEQRRLIELLNERVTSLVLSSFDSAETARMRFANAARIVSRPVIQREGDLYTPLGLFNRGRGLFHKDPREMDDMGDSDFFWIEEGDLILSGQFAWEGAVALAGKEEMGCVVSHRYPVLRGRSGIALTEYLYALLLTKHGDFLLNEHSRGAAGRNRPLNIDTLMKETIAIPNMQTQEMVAEAVYWRNALAREIAQQIGLLQERRTALISAAVTGKIDVRGLVETEAA